MVAAAAAGATTAGATTAGAAAAPGDQGEPGGPPPPASTPPLPADKGCSGDRALLSNTEDTGVIGGSVLAGVAPPVVVAAAETASNNCSGSGPRSCFRNAVYDATR